MKLKLSAVLAMVVAAYGIDDNAFMVLAVCMLLAIIAFLADIKVQPVHTKPQKSRYERAELISGAGWGGNKEEELRAHLLGAWKPMEELSETPQDKPVESRIYLLIGHVGLVIAAISSFFWWPIVAVGASLSAWSQIKLTDKWGAWSAMFMNSVLTVGGLTFCFGIQMLALAPLILIFARKGAR